MFASQPKTPSHYGRRSVAVTPQHHARTAASHASTPLAAPTTPTLTLGSSMSGRQSPMVLSAATPTHSIFSPVGMSATSMRPATAAPARHRIELMSPLPTRVAEALSTQGGAHNTGGSVDESGFAWVVVNASAYVWPCEAPGMFQKAPVQTLTLPSDECTAALTAIVASPDASTTSFLACSPSGALCFWDDIATNVYREASIPLVDDPARAVVVVSLNTVIIATVRGRLWRVRLPSLTPSLLSGSGGLLAGLGRRFSTILGMPPAGADGEGHSLRAICAGSEKDGVREVFVLMDSILQRWIMDDVREEKMWQTGILADISRRLNLDVARDALELVDFARGSNELVVLAASRRMREGVRFHVLVTDATEPDIATASVIEFDADPRDRISAPVTGVKLIAASGSGHIYIYCPLSAYAVSLSDDAAAQRLPVVEGDDVLLGGGAVIHGPALARIRRPAFLTSSTGILVAVCDNAGTAGVGIAMTATPRAPASVAKRAVTPATAQRPQRPASLAPTPLRATAVVDEDDKLMTAFSFFRAGNQAAASNFADVFLRSASSVDVDTAVLNLSADMLDAEPASDVRWAEGRSDLSSAAPMVIRQQLDDKRTRHTELVTFLTFTGALEKMSAVARHTLCEHGEKLAAAIAVRALHNSADPTVNRVIDSAIRRCVRMRGVAGSPVDAFYRQVTCVEGLLEGITDDEREGSLGSADGAGAAATAADMLRAANLAFEMLLIPGLEYRASNRDAYHPHDRSPSSRTPWTGTPYIRSALLYQFVETERCAEAQTAHTDVLVSQLVMLADLILRGFEEEIAAAEISAAETGASQRFEELRKSFEERRSSVIAPIARLGRAELALSLAERYRDFGVLAELCEALNDRRRLEGYLRDYAPQHFAEFLFQWYITKGKRRRLFELPATYDGQLARFLVAHPDLKWVHDIKLSDYTTAAATLQSESESERTSVKRKKTLVSLMKLSALAANPEDVAAGGAFGLVDVVAWCNKQLAIVAAQERLDAPPQQPLTGEEVTRRYVAKPDVAWTDLIVALQVFAMTEDSRSDESNRALLLSIWVRSVAADDFVSLSARLGLDNPGDIVLETAVRDTTTYKLASASAARGLVALVLSPDAILADPQLAPVASNAAALRLVHEVFATVARDFEIA